ncbi:hypothetical protein [Methanosarcina sp.]|nr:hypothetical protein [Methanosarcina sp.]MDW5553955.1 hypothetical protein [Methanosarcina sp.]MDW5558540.1 hypothetical protein [Methanosarcina sp.]
MEMLLSGKSTPSINHLPAGNWNLYSSTLSVSSASPSDLVLNLKVSTDNNEQDTFYIDYLEVSLTNGKEKSIWIHMFSIYSKSEKTDSYARKIYHSLSCKKNILRRQI